MCAGPEVAARCAGSSQLDSGPSTTSTLCADQLWHNLCNFFLAVPGLAHCCAVIETRHLRRFNRRHFERASIRACAESVSERLKGVEKEEDGVVGLAGRAGHRGEGFGQLRCGRSFNLIIGSVHMLQCDYSWLTRRGWP